MSLLKLELGVEFKMIKCITNYMQKHQAVDISNIFIYYIIVHLE